MGKTTLDYQAGPTRSKSSGLGFATLSAFCVIAPAIGFGLKIGPLFLLGLPLSFLGILSGIFTFLQNKESSIAILGFFLVFANLVSCVFFVRLFAGGLC
jgi:hypothetical protein